MCNIRSVFLLCKSTLALGSMLDNSQGSMLDMLSLFDNTLPSSLDIRLHYKNKHLPHKLKHCIVLVNNCIFQFRRNLCHGMLMVHLPCNKALHYQLVIQALLSSSFTHLLFFICTMLGMSRRLGKEFPSRQDTPDLCNTRYKILVGCICDLDNMLYNLYAFPITRSSSVIESF